ncbi:hypothetical protein CAJAP_02169 [Camponotus japonicus]
MKNPRTKSGGIKIVSTTNIEGKWHSINES